MGQTIEIQAADGSAEAYLTGEAGRPGVLFYIDAIGLRPRIEEMADRIASWGYVVLAPNVFYRRRPRGRPGAGRAGPARTRCARGVHGDRRDGPRPRPHPRPVRAGRRGLGRDPGRARGRRARSASPATAWVPGSPYARRGSSPAPSPPSVASTVVAWSPTTRPARTSRSTARPRSTRSGTPTRTGRCRSRRSKPWSAPWTQADRPHVNEVYAGAAHGYTMADTSMYDEAATERHFGVLRDLLARTL